MREVQCVSLRGALTLKSIFLLGPVSASVHKGNFAPLFLSPVPSSDRTTLITSLSFALVACGAFCTSVVCPSCVTTRREAALKRSRKVITAIENSSAKTTDLSFLSSNPIQDMKTFLAIGTTF